MRRQNIAIFVISLSFLRVNLPAVACCEGLPPGDPSCYECEDGKWVLRDWAECGQTLDCTFGGEGCEICVECMCEDDDTLCEPYECCIDGSCIAPMCGGCTYVDDYVWECFHWPWDPDGAPCSTTACILLIMDSATCTNKGPDWPCKKKNCDTDYVYPFEPEVIKVMHLCPCPGGYVWWEVWFQHWYGCGESCLTDGPYHKACEELFCSWYPVYLEPDGYMKKCGCSY
jgi:hypothetical protein